MKPNLTSRYSVIALCAVAVLSFLPNTQAGPNPINRKIAIDERGAPPAPNSTAQPGGDPISNPGGGRITKEMPILPPIKK